MRTATNLQTAYGQLYNL